ncbi:MAG: hypothetical protein IJY15_02160 [Thermoguttaceae bacterium]|nr:hypothetical protein [Thermoguttaceae bacterium]
MQTPLETKTAAVAAVPANSTLVLLAAVIDGTPTAAQIETARYAVEANLENVGATATSAYLTRFNPVSVDVDADESLLLTVDATLAKVAPDPLPDAAEPEPLDETPSTETASSEEVATVGNGENDATSTDAAAPDPLPEVAETSLEENAAAFVEAEASEA